LNILGIDFEDWYHPELIKQNIKNEKHNPSVINGIDKILDLLRKQETLATFFIVGELLEIQPEIFDKIIENGHEIGFHTMYHDRLDSPGYKEKFSNEIEKFAELTNHKSRGFRAPTFSLNNASSWAIDILAKNDYVYDSSIVPAKTSMYGSPNAEHKPYRITSKSIEKNNSSGKLIEFPLMTTTFLGKKIPAAGGFYLRTLPMKVTKNAIKNYEKQGIPANFYIHSWELTPEYMPKLDLPFKDNFVTFHNIDKAYQRMNDILKEFSFTSFSNYLSQNAI
jgi:polysaccharide deacetylase family protein (PEP-CTERM system associated)|tara:strand:+ start:564 stop:1400 length:837 start_codon:yes stop_codon:yes gene_type:complete